MVPGVAPPAASPGIQTQREMSRGSDQLEVQMGARRTGGLQNVYPSVTGLGRCPGGGRQRHLCGGWLGVGTGETWLRPSCRFHVCGTQAPRPPGRRPSLRACPSSLPLPLSRWRASCSVQPSRRPSRDRPGVGETGMPGTSALSLGWRGNCRSEWWSDPRRHPMMGKGPLAGRGEGTNQEDTL